MSLKEITQAPLTPLLSQRTNPNVSFQNNQKALDEHEK